MSSAGEDENPGVLCGMKKRLLKTVFDYSSGFALLYLMRVPFVTPR